MANGYIIFIIRQSCSDHEEDDVRTSSLIITTSCSTDAKIALPPLFLRSLFVFIVVYKVNCFPVRRYVFTYRSEGFSCFLKIFTFLFSFVSHYLNWCFSVILTNEWKSFLLYRTVNLWLVFVQLCIPWCVFFSIQTLPDQDHSTWTIIARKH